MQLGISSGRDCVDATEEQGRGRGGTLAMWMASRSGNASCKMSVMPARLPHRLTRRRRGRGLLGCVEKLLGDFKRAELAVLGKDPVILVR